MGENDSKRVGGLLLAAGGSSRFGAPKQLAVFDGKTLVARAAEALVSGGCHPVVVVLGAQADTIAAALHGLHVIVAVNPEWQNGMSTSIVAGLETLLGTAPRLDGVMITLADQPFVTQNTIKQFLLKYSGGRKSIISARYDGALGVPALFSSQLFAELKQLTGDQGARHIIRNAPDEMVAAVDVGDGAVDVDTEDDFRRLVDFPLSQ